MKRLIFAVILAIVSVLISGYANATVAHPENTDIVGLVGPHNIVCFNNDGAIATSAECDASEDDEGFVFVQTGDWKGGAGSGINGCGTDAVNPVSSATCPTAKTIFASCTGDGYVLVQTTKSSHFWAVKAGGGCVSIATPESTGLVPCLSSDSFDPVTGCSPLDLNPPEISVEDGYIKLDTNNGNPPPAEHCAEVSHDGRMVLDSVNGLIYICTQAGWIAK